MGTLTQKIDLHPASAVRTPPKDKSDDRAGDNGCLVYSESLTALVDWKCVGDECPAVCPEKSGTECLDDPENDELDTVLRKTAKKRAHGKNSKTKIVGFYPPEHVTNSSEIQNEGRGNEHVAR